MILVTGGTGFLGTHLAARLIQRGNRVRCGSRRKIPRFRIEGAVLPESGYVDVTVENSLAKAMEGVDTVIHLVGILTETRREKFHTLHVKGTENVINACRSYGVRRYIHISALGTGKDARSQYHKTKWLAEELVRGSGLEFTVFRPSVVFGKGDRFTTLLAKLMRLSPVVFVPGKGKNRMQPVYVEDLVEAISVSIERSDTMGKTLEVGGKDILSFNEVIDAIADVLGRRRWKIHIPQPVVKMGASIMEYALPSPPLTRDTLLMLEEDNITSRNALEDIFAMEPTPFRDGLRQYLC